uniref:Metalloendopeptidase n=1 Tax=Amphiprion percula TaxID=161767 RepID=A0A3P8SBU2_AMPPE
FYSEAHLLLLKLLTNVSAALKSGLQNFLKTLKVSSAAGCFVELLQKTSLNHMEGPQDSRPNETAFEHFHLKSCIDFKPRQTEKCYLSVRKNPGCYSYVSRIIKSGQVVSIGEQCDHLGIVEHEFLHVLGLYHEQSRYDRDDYITIMWKNIKDGTKSTPTSSTTFNAPYDYLSLMHYGKNFFSKNMENTIVTKLPQYQDKIGQRMEMSPTDIYKLNHLYNCSKFSLLLKSPLYIHYFKMFA